MPRFSFEKPQLSQAQMEAPLRGQAERVTSKEDTQFQHPKSTKNPDFQHPQPAPEKDQDRRFQHHEAPPTRHPEAKPLTPVTKRKEKKSEPEQPPREWKHDRTMPKRQPAEEQPTKDRQVKKIADFPEQPKRHDAKYQHTEDDRRSRPQAPKKPKTYDSDSSKSESDSDDDKHFYA